MNYKKTDSFRHWLECFVLLFCSLGYSLTVTQSATGISLTVDATGSYSIVTTTPAWTFSGSLAKTLTNIAQVDASDKIGPYTGITFNLTGTGPLQGTIRMYQSIPVVMFSMKTLAAMASMGVNFPDITTSPANMLHLGQQHNTFAVPTFDLASTGNDCALISYNAQGQTFVYSAADHFWEVSNTYTSGLRSSVKSWATPLPSGWELLSILAIGSGINHTCDLWGQGLRGYYGKPLPGQDEIPFRTFGYWTDHYAGYYYLVDSKYANYQEEMLAVKGHYDTLGIKMGYLMLDSWWYKKGCSQSWSAVGSGIYLYEASTAVFPNGLNAFHNKLGLPLVTHHRWYEASCSPIATTYGLSGGLPTKYAAWQNIIYHVADSGSITFEQDWLDNNALVAQHIGDLDSAMGNMAKACAEKKMTQQYCMPLPMYYQQAAKYPTLTSIRSANDGYNQGFWNSHIFNSRFAWSMGLFPWVDCFPSTNNNTGCVISCVVTGGFFPPSDKIGVEVLANILPATRRDGTLVKCDVPALPTEQTYINFGQGKAANPVTFTYTDHGNNFKTYYVWAPGAAATSYSFSPAAEGFPAPAAGMYAYNWFSKAGQFIAAGSPLTATCAAGTNAFHYWVVAPVGASGIAFLGDLSKYISCGRQRITSLVHSATQVTATVDLEPQEATVTLSGYSTVKPLAVCSNNATLGAVNFANNMFSVVLTPAAGARTPMTVSFGANPTTIGSAATQPVRNGSISVLSGRGRFVIDMGTNADFSASVYTLSGQRCFAANYQNQRAVLISSSKLKQGTYMVEIKQNTSSCIKKITVR
jgi:hypothetical protein